MITYEKNYLKELASNCADVEIYVYRGENHSIHTDSIKGLDINLDNLPDEIECDFSEMDEEEYNETILANSGVKADFDDWYDDKEAKVLVIVLDYFFYQNLVSE